MITWSSLSDLLEDKTGVRHDSSVSHHMFDVGVPSSMADKRRVNSPYSVCVPRVGVGDTRAGTGEDGDTAVDGEVVEA